jgi:hypothetical protein
MKILTRAMIHLASDFIVSLMIIYGFFAVYRAAGVHNRWMQCVAKFV